MAIAAYERTYPETVRVTRRRAAVKPWDPSELKPPRTRKSARGICRDLILSGRLDDGEASALEYVLNALTLAEDKLARVVQERDARERVHNED